MSVKAQRLTHDFQGASLSEALIWIDNAQDSYKLNFIFDELEDFTVTTSLRNVSVRDAVRQVCGFYPIHLTFDEQDIYIECIQKETQKVNRDSLWSLLTWPCYYLPIPHSSMVA